MEMQTFLELVRKLENDRCQAMVAANVELLDMLFSEQLYYGHSGGYWDSKASIINNIKGGNYKYESIVPIVEKIISFTEKTILFHGTVTIKVTIGSHLQEMHSIYMGSWQYEGTTWKFVGHQTAIKNKQK